MIKQDFSGFDVQSSRISYKIYSEPLKHIFSQCKIFVESVCNFIQNPLSILRRQDDMHNERKIQKLGNRKCLALKFQKNKSFSKKGDAVVSGLYGFILTPISDFRHMNALLGFAWETSNDIFTTKSLATVNALPSSIVYPTDTCTVLFRYPRKAGNSCNLLCVKRL